MLFLKFKVFQIKDTDVYIDISWFLKGLIFAPLTAFYFAYRMETGFWTWWPWILGVFVTVFGLFTLLLHELAHQRMAKKCGLKCGEITVFLLGVASDSKGRPRNPGQEFKISVAGPLASLAIGLFFLAMNLIFIAAKIFPLQAVALTESLAILNLSFCAFNLIPAFPLDGGRMVRALIWIWRKNYLKATEIMFWLAIVAGAALTAVAVFSANFFLPVVAIFVVGGSFFELKKVIREEIKQLRPDGKIEKREYAKKLNLKWPLSLILKFPKFSNLPAGRAG